MNNNNTNNVFPTNHSYYVVNGHVLSMTEDEANELLAAGVALYPLEDDDDADDDADEAKNQADASYFQDDRMYNMQSRGAY